MYSRYNKYTIVWIEYNHRKIWVQDNTIETVLVYYLLVSGSIYELENMNAAVRHNYTD